MNRVVPPVLLLHPDRAFCERVKRACSQRYRFLPVSSWSDLREALHSAPPLAIVIVDPYGGDHARHGLSSALHGLLREFPSATVIAACEIRGGCLEQMRTLGEWGVTRMISLEEEDTAHAIARVLESSRGRPLRTLLQRTLTATMSGRARAIVMSATDVVSTGGVGRDLARSLHVTPRTLQRWCRNAGLPAPRQLLAWMRLLLAAELLDDPGRSVLGVALACGYSSDAALRNAFRAYLELSPNALRDRGAFQTVAKAFQKALSASAPKSPAARPRPDDEVHPVSVIPLRTRSAAGARQALPCSAIEA
ncbi:MAG: helix-turn-helix domain-containing protein [Gemmatimonadetes bacterium]|nr:helix-turn-helix domain-containing protein [Gemmatimonadota bacterium]